MLEHETAEEGTDCAADHEAVEPYRYRYSSLMLVVEHVSDQSERRRHQCRACNTEQRPRGDQHPRARRESGECGSGAECTGAHEKKFSPSDAVAESAHRYERSSNQEPVYVDDPEQLRAARREIGAERGDCEV